jgi:hypothetical protein
MYANNYTFMPDIHTVLALCKYNFYDKVINIVISIGNIYLNLVTLTQTLLIITQIRIVNKEKNFGK